MNNKFMLAWKMWLFVNNTANPKYKKTLRKCLRAYITQCVILGKDNFELKYGSEYYDSFKLRFKDWLEYINNKYFWFPIYRIIPKEHRPSIINYYIEHGIPKPIHIKHHIFVNESILEYFLDQNGFEISDEYLGSLETIYYIRRKGKRD